MKSVGNSTASEGVQKVAQIDTLVNAARSLGARNNDKVKKLGDDAFRAWRKEQL